MILLWSSRSSKPDPQAAAALEARFVDRNVQVIDLDRIVAERGIDPNDLYLSAKLDPGMHWNADGHAFVAEVVAEALTPSVD